MEATEPTPAIQTPISERTLAILRIEKAIARVEAKVDKMQPDKFQDVTDAVRKINRLYAVNETLMEGLKRALTSFMSIVFPKNRPPTGDDADGSTPPPIS